MEDGGYSCLRSRRVWLISDDDLAILHEREPPKSTQSVTLHLTVPTSTGTQGHAHAHFAPTPPSHNSAAGNVKSKAQKSQANGSPVSALKNSKSETNGSSPKSTQHSKLAPSLPVTATSGKKVKPSGEQARGTEEGEQKQKEIGNGASNEGAKTARKARSIMSTTSRRSKWGDNDAEPMHEVHKRNWEAVSRWVLCIYPEAHDSSTPTRVSGL